MNNKKEHFLYLVKETRFELMTAEDAAYMALMDDVEITNVSEELGMGPELLTPNEASSKVDV